MASLTVRQLDDRLKKLLRVRAAKSGRSVEDEVRTILREATEEIEGVEFDRAFSKIGGKTATRRSRTGRYKASAARHRRRHRCL